MGGREQRGTLAGCESVVKIVGKVKLLNSFYYFVDKILQKKAHHNSK